MDVGVFCVTVFGDHFFFLTVFTVNAVIQSRHVGGVHAVLRQEGHVGVDFSCTCARPSTLDGKTWGLGYKWGRLI